MDTPSSFQPSDPAALSERVVREIMEIGLKQGHHCDAWRAEPVDNHLDKALRHALTYRLMREGNSTEPDSVGEDRMAHLKRAVCRLALVLAQEIDRERRGKIGN